MTPWHGVDPFELPEWLGAGDVTWRATSPLGRPLVRGVLATEGEEVLGCDVLGVDEACPRPLADEALRTAAHLAWRRGDLHLVEYGGRLTLPVPGCAVGADLALAAVERLAHAVAADPAAYTVVLVVGGRGRR